MSKRITWRANALICLTILLGFALTSYISYHSNREVFEEDAERVSLLAADGIVRSIDAQFTQPINVSLTMANDSFLKEHLSVELSQLNDATYLESLRAYLDAYRKKYGYDSVFLTSSATNRYYHFNGIDRTLDDRSNPENDWYYAFLEGGEEYALNVDNDEATHNEITVFINARIVNNNNATLGIVGVGFRLEDLRGMFAAYEQQTDTRAYLVDQSGTVKVTTTPATPATPASANDLREQRFESSTLAGVKDDILGNREGQQSQWYSTSKGSGYLVSQYIPYLDWYLVVDHDTSDLDRQIAQQFCVAIAIIAVVIALVLLATTSIFRRYNDLIVKQTAAAEQEHKTMFQEAAEQLYDTIYEIDVTRDRAASEDTIHYFKNLGAPPNTSFSETLALIAETQVKEEFRQHFLETFCPASALAAYERGEDGLTYDFLMTEDGETYSWTRINAHLFTWSQDGSVRMMVYRQNIDKEKRREHAMIEQMQRDSLTGLYNKAATQEHIHNRLAGAPQDLFAFFILDIDGFKQVNDRYGHSSGDTVLTEFALALGAQFRREDVVGRIGGDEFSAFLRVPSTEAAERKAAELVEALNMEVETDSGACRLSASIGVALAPLHGHDFETLYRCADQALYRAKALGKNRYALGTC